MNVHQLELFYHVALHEGVSRAAKALQKEQPTLSKQINDLEDRLRAKLYHRRPFELTEKGAALFAAIEPFFRDLPKLEARIKGGDLIRIGASPLVLAEHLPAVEKEVRKQFPRLRATLREANQPELVEWVEREEIDLAITLLPRRPPQKVFSKLLVELPMALLVPQKSPVRASAQLWKKAEAEAGEVSAGLVCLTEGEMLCREFQERLRRMDVEWRPTIEVGSLNLVERYAMEGYGIGLTALAPGARPAAGLRILELPDFPTLPLGMLWRDDEDKLGRAFRQALERRAKEFSGRKGAG